MDPAFGVPVTGTACIRVWWTILLVLAMAGCQESDVTDVTAPKQASTTAPKVIYTVNYPLAWFAERIGGEEIEVRLPVPEGVDPAHWMPSPEIVLEYQDADLVLLNGAGYAQWVQFASLSPGKVVDTTRGLDDQLVEAGDVTHSHGPAGEHDHRNVASHTWLNPVLAAQQAGAVADALSRLAPDSKGEHRQRLEALQQALTELDQRLGEALTAVGESGVLYSHPVYQYLDDRYALNGHTLTWEPTEDPGETEWSRLETMLSERPIATMIWEAEPSPATSNRLRQLGVEPVVFETAALAPAQGDYLTIMNRNLEHLRALGGGL